MLLRLPSTILIGLAIMILFLRYRLHILQIQVLIDAI
jgi:hypothetical protein